MEGTSAKKEDICAIVIDTISRSDGRDPLDLPPLHDSVDVDALCDLFATTTGGVKRSGWIKFRYAGYRVEVEFDDEPTVTIEKISASE